MIKINSFFLQKKKYLSKCSYGPIECNFHYLAHKLSTERPKINHSLSKLWKQFMTFFGKKKSSVKSYLNVECYRLNHVEKFSRRNQRMTGQCLKVFEKLEFSHKKKQIPSECYYGYVECIFHNLTDSFPLKAQNFCSISLMIKIITFFKKRSFHRQNCVAAKHAIFTTSRINFRQKAKTFAQGRKW